MKSPFDEYELRARIFPALIVSIPALTLLYASAPATKVPLRTAGIGTLLEVAVLYFLGRIARDAGAKQQNRLFGLWGGPPTTQILRHNNSLIDPFTKARLKATLQAVCGLSFPSEEEERSDPLRTDMVYSSAIKAVLEQRRDKKKFRLIFDENCNYGFARNLYGVRWMGISVASICLILASLMIYWHGFSFPWLFSVSVSAIALLLLAIYVNSHMVKRCAEAYAVAVLRSCERQKAKRQATKEGATDQTKG